jgi:ABC-type amino acid transport substrate-binding protein
LLLPALGLTAGAEPAQDPGPAAALPHPQAVPAEPPDLARLRRAGEIRIAMYAGEFPPFFATGPDGEPVGLDADLARDIAARLGVRPRFLRTAASWDATVAMVQRGEADIAVSALSRTLGRAERIAFSPPYATLHQVLLLNRLSAAQLGAEREPHGSLDRPEARIGALAGTAFVEFLRGAFPNATARVVERWDEGVADLIEGRIDALLGDEINTAATLRQRPDYGLLLRPVVLPQPDRLAVAVGWQDLHLRYWLELYVATAQESGFLDRLLARYRPSQDGP